MEHETEPSDFEDDQTEPSDMDEKFPSINPMTFSTCNRNGITNIDIFTNYGVRSRDLPLVSRNHILKTLKFNIDPLKKEEQLNG